MSHTAQGSDDRSMTKCKYAMFSGSYFDPLPWCTCALTGYMCALDAGTTDICLEDSVLPFPVPVGELSY